MGDAAYWDNWADAIGPEHRGGARQQRRSSHSRLQPKAIRTGIRARFRRIRAGDQGAHCRPWTPLAIFPVRGEAGRAAHADCEFTPGSVLRCVTDWKKMLNVG